VFSTSVCSFFVFLFAFSICACMNVPAGPEGLFIISPHIRFDIPFPTSYSPPHALCLLTAHTQRISDAFFFFCLVWHEPWCYVCYLRIRIRFQCPPYLSAEKVLFVVCQYLHINSLLSQPRCTKRGVGERDIGEGVVRGQGCADRTQQTRSPVPLDGEEGGVIELDGDRGDGGVSVMDVSGW
jgi:hypothetical protein